jgi:hypothetical protein
VVSDKVYVHKGMVWRDVSLGVRYTQQHELGAALEGWGVAVEQYESAMGNCQAWMDEHGGIPPHELGVAFHASRKQLLQAYDELDVAACGQTAQTMRHNELAFSRSIDFLEDYPPDVLAELIAHLHGKVRAARLGK